MKNKNQGLSPSFMSFFFYISKSVTRTRVAEADTSLKPEAYFGESFLVNP